MIFTRRGFIGLFPAAFVATNLTAKGETLPTHQVLNGPITLSGIPTGSPVVERRLYRVVPGHPERHILIATAKPDDHEWNYLDKN